MSMNKVILYGKEYPNRVTMGAMIDFKRETGKDVNEICLLYTSPSPRD